MIDKKISDKIKGITQEIYTKLEFDGIIRVDYIIYQGKVYVNEINTVPGSLAYYLFVKTLKEYTELLTTLINDSLVRGAKDSTLIKNFSSGILSIGGCKASKRLKK